MKLIEPSVELIEQEPGIEGIYKQIEVAARLCYKSEDKITEDSAKKFVDMLINNGHGAMLEHGTVYLKVEFKYNTPSNAKAYHIWDKYDNNKYSISLQIQPIPGNPDGFVAITTNLRVLVENGWLNDLQFICEPTEYHEKRYTLKFTTSIGITRELIRHRHFSFANESTRYCNYSKDKFGGEITFVKPYWFDNQKWCIQEDFLDFLAKAEENYMYLLNWLQPQQAREVLPLCTKSEIIVTGFESDWENFLKLRCAKDAHPDIQYLANRVMDILKVPQIKIE